MKKKEMAQLRTLRDEIVEILDFVEDLSDDPTRTVLSTEKELAFDAIHADLSDAASQIDFLLDKNA